MSTDPVDTDALREHARQEQVAADASRNQMRRADHDEAAALCRAAADEVDRLRRDVRFHQDHAVQRSVAYEKLRSVVEKAPHAFECPSRVARLNPKPCTCWKADVL